jgi:FAD/FMN-containing dehydrogenase
VVPGTRFITIGGAIAADVHGKNHHRDGGFGEYVDCFVLALAGGELVRVSRDEHPDLFVATIGGMGLTGTILEASLRLRPVETGWIRQQTIVASNLDAAIVALEDGDQATYSVAWIDCLAKGRDLGRSLVFLGEHACLNELDSNATANRYPIAEKPRFSMPFDAPRFALSQWSVRTFNELYFRRGIHSAGRVTLIPATPYFFPLDKIGAWNRIYGRQGFVQHQCVLPADGARAVLSEILERIASRGGASFLAVLKKLGPAFGLLSFPFPGYTLALDFPMTSNLLDFLEELDRLIVGAGGRLYLAKDARQSRATFEAGYSELPHFREIRQSVDPGQRIKSRLADRLGI